MAVDFKDFQKLAWYYQVAIVAGFCAGMLALFWYQFLITIEDDIAAKRNQLAELQATIAKSVLQQKRFAQLKKEAADLQVKLDQLKLILPLEKETDEILRAVQQSASASALRILRVGPRPVIDHEVYTEWPIDMEVVGTYHNIGAFLDRIRQLPRIVNIGGLRIQGRSTEGDQASFASVSATYTATTFVYKEEQIALSAPPAVTK
jgi:type IV pilus assembly protein PilO